MAFEFIQAELKHREMQDLRRHVTAITQNCDAVLTVAEQHYLNFAGNDYLGLSQSEAVLQSYVEGLSLYGSSSSASPLVCGYYREHQRLEETFADSIGQQAALLFSSGFAANKAICAALFAKHSGQGHILADKLMHASFIEGAVASQANFSRFAHNDINHCQTKLASMQGDILIATEGVFSMDGDIAELDALAKLAQQHPSRPWLMVDDAHALGILGERGLGSSEFFQNTKIDIAMATFGKALGVNGAVVAGSHDLIDYLRNVAGHYVYSTGFSPAQARAVHTSLLQMINGHERHQLAANIEYFRSLCVQKNIPVSPSHTPIQILRIGSNDALMKAATKLKSLGIWVGAIRPPTVPANSARLRITLSALHSQQDIDALSDALCLALAPDNTQSV